MVLQEELNKLDIPKSIAIGFAIAALYWILFYNPGKSIQDKIDMSAKTIAKSQASIAQVRKALEDEKRFKTDINEINREMKDFLNHFSPDMDTNKLSARVSTFAEENDIVVVRLKPIEKSSEFPTYLETAVEFEVEGPFHNIMEFLSNLTKMGKAIDFSTMEFKTTVKGDYPLVSLKTTLVVYSSNETISTPSTSPQTPGQTGGQTGG